MMLDLVWILVIVYAIAAGIGYLIFRKHQEGKSSTPFRDAMEKSKQAQQQKEKSGEK